MKFYVGLHQPANARHVERCMVSVNRLRTRRSPVPSGEWIMDSGAFTEVQRRGPLAWNGGAVYRYADDIARVAEINGSAMVAAVAPDLMCEPEMIRRVGIGQQSARVHAGITIHQYILVMDHFGWSPPCYVMPVLQGYTPADYVHCIGQYGPSLTHGMWVGVGSVCKRNARVEDVEAVLRAILAMRPDLRLHGFGLKLTALNAYGVRSRLYSADSMAWSWHARRNGRSANDPAEAVHYAARVDEQRPSPTLVDMLDELTEVT